MDNFQKLHEQWASKVDIMDEEYEAGTEARIVLHKDQQKAFEKFLTETGFTHKILLENVET